MTMKMINAAGSHEVAIKKVKLANGISFPVTSFHSGDTSYVSDIHSRTNAAGEGSIVLTIKQGAEIIKRRIYASWYLTFINTKGEEVKV